MSLDNAFRTMFPNCKDADRFICALQDEIEKRRWCKEQVAMFLAQTGHESAGYTCLIENLNYSAKALYSVFRKYFQTETLADAYARQPEKIANKVYANRMGNGSMCSGDGWKYRGRGILQLTGKSNYRSFEYDTGIGCVHDPDVLCEPENAVISAFWYWDKNRCADYADIERVTKLVNGGLNGLDDRKHLYTQAMALL